MKTVYSKYLKFIVLLSVLTAFCVCGKERNSYLGNGIIEVQQTRLYKTGKISGGLPPREEVSVLAKKFFKALSIFPKNFIIHSELRYVTFIRRIKFRGTAISGMANKSTKTIYLSTLFSEQNVYHELFHIFDREREQDAWNSLNEPGFRYTGNKITREKVPHARQARKPETIARYRAGFVTEYAMSNEAEDRAETFSYMVVEGPDFLKRTKKSQVLRKKMEYIIQMTSDPEILGKEFWEQRLQLKLE